MADQPFLASNSFDGDGVRTVWEFSFEGLATDAPLTAKPYIDSADVRAELITGTGDEQVTVPQAFLFETANSIRVEPPVPVGTILRIYRQTENRFPLVNYQDLQSVGASDLDLANRQAVYIVQEARDAARGSGNVSAETLAIAQGAAQAASASAAEAAATATAAQESAGEAVAAVDLLRTDLAEDGGAALVGANGATLQSYLGERVSIEAFGAVPGGDATAAFAAAKLALAGTNKVLYLPNTTYTLSGTIYPGTLNVYSDGCLLQKAHAGVGMVLEGGQASFDFEGTLYFDGHGVGRYDARLGIAPTATDQHGIHFKGNAFRIAGKIHSRCHAGDAFRYTVDGNMNRSDADWLFGWDSVRNHYFEGTQDDFSVVQMGLHSYSSWQDGVRFSDTFMGRACTLYIYNELSCQDGVSNGVYIGKLRTSELDIYSEPAATSGVSWLATANCQDLLIEDTRAGPRTVSSPSVQVTIGGKAYPTGLNPEVITDRYDQSAGSQRTYTKRLVGPSAVPLVDHRFRSDGQYTARAYNVAGAGHTEGGWKYDGYLQETYGGKSTTRFQAANGTFATPTAIGAGAPFFELNAHLKSTTGYSHGMQLRGVLESLGGGSNSFCDAVLALTRGAATPVDVVKFPWSGDVETLIAGKGIICVTPDGTKRYRLGVSNAGALTITLL